MEQRGGAGMILQALNEYYERKAADPDSGIAPEGFVHKEIPFVLVLDIAGSLVNIEDTRQTINKRLRARSFLVPQGEKRASNIKANLLWDNTEYIFGIPVKGKPERVIQQHQAFIERVESLGLENEVGIRSVVNFLRNSPQSSLTGSQYEKEIKADSPFMTFRLNTDTELVCQRKSVIDRINMTSDDKSEPGFCLITGRQDVQANLQPAIKGVQGTNTTGGNIVSFNLSAFNSFGKEQGANAPMGEKASFAYTTALNHLLGKDSIQKLRVGDATTVFWSDKKSHLEDDFSALFDEPDKDNPDKLTDKVRALLKSVDTGSLPPEDNKTRFFILGLSPNSARISVRFWNTGTVAEFYRKIASHFHDLEIIHAPHQRDHLSIWWLLRSIAALGKSDNIPPNLAGDWMRTILNGSAYPETLFQSAIRRIHAEREVSYERAAIIKACLNRKNRLQIQTQKEITVSLDKDNTNPGYRTGRLFAVLEKIQEEANPGINATIRDRYYSAASGTPSSVFPILLRMKNHHLGKLEKGREIYFEKLMGEIVSDIPANGLPAQLSLPDQGRFAIGYYHQRQAFFTKTDKPVSNTTAQGE
jgi:CRISPR-associated protein Csd1